MRRAILKLGLPGEEPDGQIIAPTPALIGNIVDGQRLLVATSARLFGKAGDL